MVNIIKIHIYCWNNGIYNDRTTHEHHIVQHFQTVVASSSVSSPSFIARNGAEEVVAARWTSRVVAHPTVQAAAVERMSAAKRGPRHWGRVLPADGTSNSAGRLPCLKFWEFSFFEFSLPP